MARTKKTHAADAAPEGKEETKGQEQKRDSKKRSKDVEEEHAEKEGDEPQTQDKPSAKGHAAGKRGKAKSGETTLATPEGKEEKDPGINL